MQDGILVLQTTKNLLTAKEDMIKVSRQLMASQQSIALDLLPPSYLNFKEKPIRDGTRREFIISFDSLENDRTIYLPMETTGINTIYEFKGCFNYQVTNAVEGQEFLINFWIQEVSYPFEILSEVRSLKLPLSDDDSDCRDFEVELAVPDFSLSNIQQSKTKYSVIAIKLMEIKDQVFTGTSLRFSELLLNSDCFEGQQFKNGTIWAAPIFKPEILKQTQTTIIQEEMKYKPKFIIAIVINVFFIVIFIVALIVSYVIKKKTIDKAGVEQGDKSEQKQLERQCLQSKEEINAEEKAC